MDIGVVTHRLFADMPGEFERLSGSLGVRDPDLLRSKLELPDTPWCVVEQPMPDAVAKTLEAVAS